MAAQIGATPVLEGREAKEWMDKVEKEKDVRLGPVPTPKLEELRLTVLANVERRKK